MTNAPNSKGLFFSKSVFFYELLKILNLKVYEIEWYNLLVISYIQIFHLTLSLEPALTPPRYPGNWMRYVNTARHEQEQNIVAFQIQHDIYFEVIRDILPGIANTNEDLFV